MFECKNAQTAVVTMPGFLNSENHGGKPEIDKDVIKLIITLNFVS